jgi:hypothetical protein
MAVLTRWRLLAESARRPSSIELQVMPGAGSVQRPTGRMACPGGHRPARMSDVAWLAAIRWPCFWLAAGALRAWSPRSRALSRLVTISSRQPPYRALARTGAIFRRSLSTTGRRSRVLLNRRFGRGCPGIRMPRTDGRSGCFGGRQQRAFFAADRHEGVRQASVPVEQYRSRSSVK